MNQAPPSTPLTSRRTLLQAGSLVLLLGTQHLARGATIVAVRIWPAPEYSRVTIESDSALTAKQFFVATPPRLAVDIEGLDLNPALRELVAKVQHDDPNIAGIRVGQNAPGVVRMVIDLKQAALPQVFTLPPIAAYRHRLVFDLYPAAPADPLEALIAERMNDPAAPAANPAAPVKHAAIWGKTPPASEADPLEALIAQQNARASQATTMAPATVVASMPAPTAPAPSAATASAAPSAPATPPTPAAPIATAARRTDRLIIIALDPGHGGEDPGAIGPAGTREKDVVLQVAHLLRERINATTVGGNPMRAYLTRDGDYFVPLGTRVQKAQRV